MSIKESDASKSNIKSACYKALPHDRTFNKNIVRRSAEIMFFAQAGRALRKCSFRAPDNIFDVRESVR
jgi:hypothetical protein